MENISTNSTLVSCQEVDWALAKYILIPVELLIAIASSFGNILVIVAVYKKRQLRTNLNFFIVSMAISDLLVPLFSLPLHLNLIINGQSWIGGPFGEFTCKFVTFAVEVSTAVSILTMVIIAAERFYCVHFPFKVALISRKSRYRLIASTWAIALALQSYAFFVRRLDAENKCIHSWEPIFDNKKAEAVMFIVLFICQYALPFAVLAILYTMIIVKLHRQNIIRHLSSQEAKRRENRNRKITLMAAIVALVFLVAWSPFWILIIRVRFVDGHFDCYLVLAVGPTVSLYTVVNPLVYYVFNKDYRRAMNAVLRYSRKKPLIFQDRKTSQGVQITGEDQLESNI